MTQTATTLARFDAASVVASFPASLVSAGSARRIDGICTVWPEGAACHVLELRLDGRGYPVDAAQAYLGGTVTDLAARASGQPMMAQVQPFLDWAAKARPRAISLEWDLEDDNPDQPRCPGAFFSLPDPAPTDLSAHVAAGVTALDRAGLVPPVLAALSLCAPFAKLRQVGVLISRPGAGVRLVLDCGSAEAARETVRRLDPTVLPTLDILLALPGFENAPRLNLDILPGGGIGPRIGIEFGDARTRFEQVRSSLDGLVQLGLVDGVAARALLERAEWASLDQRLMTGLSHLKASSSGSGRPQIKAYQAVLMRPDAMME